MSCTIFGSAGLPVRQWTFISRILLVSWVDRGAALAGSPPDATTPTENSTHAAAFRKSVSDVSRVGILVRSIIPYTENRQWKSQDAE